MLLLKNVFSFEEAYKIENYPYGFRAKTTMSIWLEQNKRGMRVVRQTVNPSTGKLNKPKKSVYYSYVRLVENEETGHIETSVFNSNSVKGYMKYKERGLFEDKDLEKQLGEVMRRVEIKSLSIYGGYDFDIIRDFTLEQMLEIDEKNEEGDTEYVNQFKTEEGKQPGYSPFKVTTHIIN